MNDNSVVVDKLWGTERWLVNEPGLYCVKEMTLVPGYKCSLHYHRLKDETFYINKGQMVLFVDNLNGQSGVIRLEEGDHYRIQPGVAHRFMAGRNETCWFIECSTYHDDEDVVRLEPSKAI